MTGIAPLKGTVKHYDWGGKNFIPSLLHTGNAGNKPFAEYWLGVHPLADCQVIINDQQLSLRDVIYANREEALGHYVHEKFGDLPYLLKILDVKDMLSIQVHPSRVAAEEGYDRENAAHIPPDAPGRNYKDANHKPELIVALSEFWLLHGFKPEEKLNQILDTVKELNGFKKTFDQKNYQGLYRLVMEMSQSEVNRILQPLLERIIPLYRENKLQKNQEDFWAARAALTYSSTGNIDRGIFSIYLFNLLQLKKGEAIFQDEGMPHAYLEGQNVEIMANSDNVLRGGLTNKHIDVPELLRNVKCVPTIAHVLAGETISDHEKVYRTTAPDFELSVFELKMNEAASFTTRTAEILLLTSGRIKFKGQGLVMEAGEPSAVVFAGTAATMIALTDSTMVFRASVPVHKGE